MAQGKFSKPRPSSEEDRQIEQAFRQVTGQEPAPPEPESSADDLFTLLEDLDDTTPRQPQDPQISVPKVPEFPDDPDPEAEEEAEPDFWDSLLAFGRKAADYCRKNKTMLLAAACGVTLVLIILILVLLFTGTSDPYGGKILNNVFLADVNVGGMTKNEAVSALRAATEEDYAQEYMVIDLDGTTLRLAPGDVAVSLDAKAAVEAAYDYGRTGTQAEQEQAYQDSLSTSHIIGLLPYLELNEDYILDVLNTYVQDATSTLTQASFQLDGPMPELATDKFDPDAPCQTLVITTGIPGVTFDVDKVYNQVLDAYSLHTFLVTVEDVTPVTDPDPVDLEAIYEQVAIEPVDATVNMSTYQVVPGSYGYGFDMEEAQKLVDAADYGQQIHIPMEYIEPEILEEEVFYRDVLGEAKTPHTNSENRNTNLRLACEAINGLVLEPGQTFSFNDTLGERTTAKGYKYAPSYSGDTLVDTVGGGICQVSSTLYYCTLLSDLATVSRTNHGFPTTYIDYGMDATVSWKSTDFKFKNSSNFPIKIEAEVSDGYVKVRILGTDTRNYYVKMEYSIVNTVVADTEYVDYEYDNEEGYRDGDVIRSGVNGYLIKTYKVKYDKETNKLISRDYEATSQYKTVDKLVARVEEKPTEPTTPPTEETTPPTVETTPPTEETTDPTEGTTAPSEETTDPTEGTTAPSEETTDPTGDGNGNA